MPYSDIFNAQCYLNNYYDLQKSYLFKLKSGDWGYSLSKHPGREQFKISDDPYRHWKTVGQKEGRVPGCMLPGTIFSPEFNSKAYLARYYDIRAASWAAADPLAHYNKYGILQGRIPGFELVTTEQLMQPHAVVSPGTTLLIDNTKPTNTETGTANVIQDQDEFLKQNQVPGDNQIQPGTPQRESIDENSIINQSGSKSNLLIYGIGAIALILFLKKKKKRK